MANIGDPVRRYTVIPLDQPVTPTKEPAPSLPETPPVKVPEKEPA